MMRGGAVRALPCDSSAGRTALTPDGGSRALGSRRRNPSLHGLVVQVPSPTADSQGGVPWRTTIVGGTTRSAAAIGLAMISKDGRRAVTRIGAWAPTTAGSRRTGAL